MQAVGGIDVTRRSHKPYADRKGGQPRIDGRLGALIRLDRRSELGLVPGVREGLIREVDGDAGGDPLPQSALHGALALQGAMPIEVDDIDIVQAIGRRPAHLLVPDGLGDCTARDVATWKKSTCGLYHLPEFRRCTQVLL